MARFHDSAVCLCVGMTALAGQYQTAPALENHVTVESRTFHLGQTACTVGVFFENVDPIVALALPLEIRSIDSGAYMATGFWRAINDSSRFGRSPLAQCADEPWPAPCSNINMRTYSDPALDNSCSGPLSSAWGSRGLIDYVAPDALLFSFFATGDPGLGEDVDLDPGRDSLVTDSAGLWIGFTVTSVDGQFELDTCCVLPNVHLAYLGFNSQLLIPSFTKGVITIACQCPCAADPNCDGTSTDILDVMETINVAFRGKPATVDAGCTSARTDVNCDGVTDVVDAVSVALVSLAGVDPALMFCEPCERDRVSM